MVNGRTQHPNAVLTPVGRRRLVGCVLEQGWTIEATAERFQVDAKTVRKWRDRFLADGDAGLLDRSSRPKRSPNRTPRLVRRRVVLLRKKRRWGADRIAFDLELYSLGEPTFERLEGQLPGAQDSSSGDYDVSPVFDYAAYDSASKTSSCQRD